MSSTSSSSSREWNAAEYHRLSAPQFEWGQRVLNELHLRGDECVLDAGCGTGKLTRLLLENLPHGKVVGVDLSCNMVTHARQNLEPGYGSRVSLVAADLLDLPFSNCFDGIFSTASFHWVTNHDRLFLNLYSALRRGGWLHAQCGGGPNLARLRQRVRELSQGSPFAEWLADFREPWLFSDAEEAARRLRSAGFEEVKTWLEQAAFTAKGPEEFEEYLRTFVLHRHLEMLPDAELRSTLLKRLMEWSAASDAPFVLDYWRLNIRAVKAG